MGLIEKLKQDAEQVTSRARDSVQEERLVLATGTRFVRLHAAFFVCAGAFGFWGLSALPAAAASPSAGRAVVARGPARHGFDRCLIGSWKLTASLDFAGRNNGALVGLKMKVSRTGGSARGYQLGLLRLDFRDAKPVGAESGIPTTIRGNDLVVVWSEPGHPGGLQVKSEKPALIYTNMYGSHHSKSPIWDAADYTCRGHTLKLTFLGVGGGALLSRATFTR